jgi:hypothetical protein
MRLGTQRNETALATSTKPIRLSTLRMVAASGGAGGGRRLNIQRYRLHDVSHPLSKRLSIALFSGSASSPAIEVSDGTFSPRCLMGFRFRRVFDNVFRGWHRI